MIKVTSIIPEKCSCGSGYSFDRYIEGKKSCPACDPLLGDTPEQRIAMYKKLISTPNTKLFHNLD